jgi:hypothetical protein
MALYPCEIIFFGYSPLSGLKVCATFRKLAQSLSSTTFSLSEDKNRAIVRNTTCIFYWKMFNTILFPVKSIFVNTCSAFPTDDFMTFDFI